MACFVPIRELILYLMHDPALLAATALIGGHFTINYCNSLLEAYPDLCRLQCVQNSPSRIVANTIK